jgi:hypothetical protein
MGNAPCCWWIDPHTFSSLADKRIEDPTTFENVKEFTHGFVTGLGQNLGLEQFVDCAGEGYQSLINIYQSATHLIMGSTVFDSLIGLEKFGEAIVHVSRGMFECQLALNADFSELLHQAQLFQNHATIFLSNLAHRIATEGNEIVREYNECLSAW